jgi:hypothetical protein
VGTGSDDVTALANKAQQRQQQQRLKLSLLFVHFSLVVTDLHLSFVTSSGRMIRHQSDFLPTGWLAASAVAAILIEFLSHAYLINSRSSSLLSPSSGVSWHRFFFIFRVLVALCMLLLSLSRTCLALEVRV